MNSKEKRKVSNKLRVRTNAFPHKFVDEEGIEMQLDKYKMTFSPEKEKRLCELRKEFNVSWQYGDEDVHDVLNNAIANYLQNRFGREVVRKK